ncbi:MAG: tRNA (adenosine(37)-N6)-dimethylallyltransferase MiaA [Alphaproteobacteria bacterium]|nr:tRNA (adenosine(37)-N6)-dimethylallyltransferase MiaA [Alphaproteobacteria bacterium]MBV8549113.1 tRNA (adenosine(37)-N6)-dimethylallyltransferase MiaA [Alphaproteobacteria bacterium]
MSLAKIILVAGPTASGKSAFAAAMAARTGGVIINTDALQIYAGLPLLSAQPTPEQRAMAPHKLYGTTDASERSSAGKWLRQAQAAIAECLQAGQTPIMVGGTGLYFQSLLGGLAEIPNIPEAAHEEAHRLYMEIGEGAFRQKLASLDAESASRIAPNDRQRLTRAYEVAIHTGKPLSAWHRASVGADLGAGSITLPYAGHVTVAVERHLIMPERDILYQQCNQRFHVMLEQGALREVEGILPRHLDDTLPAMKTIGVRELADYLSGNCSLEAAISNAQQATRNYAKRQMTWFRNQWPKT